MDSEQTSGPADERSLSLLPVAPVSRRRKLLVWVLFAGLPLCGWLGWTAAMNSSQMQDYQRLQQERSGIQTELEETRLRHQQLEVDLLVARQSASDGQQTIDDLEQQLFRLQQDLAQYQGALAPNAMNPGVRFQAFELQATDVPGVFRYKVMVSRVGNESDTVQASLTVSVQGKLEGKDTRVSLSELTGGRISALELNFRYFQVVPANGNDAELMLPVGFVPESVHLRAEQDGKLLLEQTMEWTETGVRS
ncbi:hypothetical protein SAMN05216198_3839 [Halopseudomonas litoralis]|uniref:Uncharacterized protein n=1 Tax=Halopseudomonas litoralis TaxID=797277 RepID=A0A1H1Y3W0_9GAMM|nr:DUF6776 family protein [Halopseudomonas litoralis]SDT16104.1 hypothetical protein SAMN05216198_3839 [Halopseudomonas litoralis]